MRRASRTNHLQSVVSAMLGRAWGCLPIKPLLVTACPWTSTQSTALLPYRNHLVRSKQLPHKMIAKSASVTSVTMSDLSWCTMCYIVADAPKCIQPFATGLAQPSFPTRTPVKFNKVCPKFFSRHDLYCIQNLVRCLILTFSKATVKSTSLLEHCKDQFHALKDMLYLELAN